MKDIMYWFYCAIGVCTLYCTSAQAETAEGSLSNSVTCSKEELTTFFPKQVVQSVLIKAKIPSEQAASVARELSQKNFQLTKIVEEKAAKLDPDPFKDLSHRDLAIKIYRETLYEMFASALKSHGITNEDQIQTLLDEMQMEQSKLFIECIRKQQQSSPPS